MNHTNLISDAINAKSIFGTVNPPAEIAPLIQKGGNGAGGISLLLNNGITLLYIVAGIAFTIMVIYSGVEWVLSGGDKAKIEAAQKRLVNALIGITLMAVAFAIIRIVGTFTGFQFYNNYDQYYIDNGVCIHKYCPAGTNDPTNTTNQQCVYERQPTLDKCH